MKEAASTRWSRSRDGRVDSGPPENPSAFAELREAEALEPLRMSHPLRPDANTC
jgi:hypothetical protein